MYTVSIEIFSIIDLFKLSYLYKTITRNYNNVLAFITQKYDTQSAPAIIDFIGNKWDNDVHNETK